MVVGGISGCCCPQAVLWELPQPASLSLSGPPPPPPRPSVGPPPSLHMTAQKTTSRWLYSHSFVHFQHRDTRQIMLNDRRWLPEEWLLCCRCQVCKCWGATLYIHPRPHRADALSVTGANRLDGVWVQIAKVSIPVKLT